MYHSSCAGAARAATAWCLCGGIQVRHAATLPFSLLSPHLNNHFNGKVLDEKREKGREVFSLFFRGLVLASNILPNRSHSYGSTEIPNPRELLLSLHPSLVHFERRELYKTHNIFVACYYPTRCNVCITYLGCTTKGPLDPSDILEK